MSELNNILDSLFDRLKSVDYGKLLESFYDTIVTAGNKLGRGASRYMLYLYYILKEGDMTANERALAYAALAYILIPGDLLPRRVFHLLGITDDAVALVYVIKKVKGKLTPEIKMKVEKQLDDWFGYKITRPDEQ